MSVYLGFIFSITSAFSSLTPWCLDCSPEAGLQSVCFCLLCEDSRACLLHPGLLLRFLLPEAPSLQDVVHQASRQCSKRHYSWTSANIHITLPLSLTLVKTLSSLIVTDNHTPLNGSRKANVQAPERFPS